MELLPIFGKYVLYSDGRRVTSSANLQKALTVWALNNGMISVKTALKNNLVK